MSIKSTHFRFSDSFLRDLDWLGKQYGGLDRTNVLRVVVAEAKARKKAELAQAPKPTRERPDTRQS